MRLIEEHIYTLKNITNAGLVVLYISFVFYDMFSGIHQMFCVLVRYKC